MLIWDVDMELCTRWDESKLWDESDIVTIKVHYKPSCGFFNMHHYICKSQLKSYATFRLHKTHAWQLQVGPFHVDIIRLKSLSEHNLKWFGRLFQSCTLISNASLSTSGYLKRAPTTFILTQVSLYLTLRQLPLYCRRWRRFPCGISERRSPPEGSGASEITVYRTLAEREISRRSDQHEREIPDKRSQRIRFGKYTAQNI